MTEITIRSFAKFRELFGEEKKLDVPHASTIYDALILFAGEKRAAQTELFDKGVIRFHVVIMYNQERIDAEDASEIILSDGDEIVLYPPVSGG